MIIRIKTIKILIKSEIYASFAGILDRYCICRNASKATTHVEDVDKHEGSDSAQPQIGAVKMVTLITRMTTLTVIIYAGLVKLEDTSDLRSADSIIVRVRLPYPAPI